MSNIWFTSDTHFGHANIIRFCDRPFKNVGEMNEALVANWNKVVKPDDEVYHMGDFSFERKPQVTAARLNGRKYLIKGNHDKPQHLKAIAPHFEWIKDYASLRIGRQRFILFHYAMRNWHHCYKGTIHLYGHAHGGMKDYGRSTDVGVDCWNYAPVSMEEIVYLMKDREMIKHHV